MPGAGALGPVTLLQVGILFVSGFVALVLTGVLWQFRDSPIAKPLLVAVAGSGFWCLVLALEVVLAQSGSISYPGLNALDVLRYIGIYTTVLGVFFFGLEFTGRERFVNRRIVVLTAILPVFFLISVGTNEWHYLFWRGRHIPGPGSPSTGWGPLFYAHMTFTYVILGITGGLLLSFVVRSRRLFQTQGVLVLLAMIVPMVGNVGFIVIDAITFDPAPMAFTVSSILFFLAIYKYRFANVTPVGWETILTNMDEGVIVVNEDDRILQANDTVQELFGVDRAPYGRSVWDFLPDDDRLETAVERLLASEGEQADEIRLRDRWLSMYASPVLDDRNRSVGRLILLADITERRKRERELEQYTELVQTVGDPMFVLNADGEFERVNDAFLKYANAKREDIIGEHATEFMREQDYERGKTLLAEIVNEDRQWDTFEMQFTPIDGDPIPSQTKATALVENGEFAGAAGVIRDITTRKHREEQLHLLRQVFGRVLRHNLRNDMTVIRGAADQLSAMDDEAVREQAEVILDRSENLLSTSENVRELATIIDELDETQELDAAEIVARVVDRVQGENGATVDFSAPEEARVNGHIGLERAVQNLVENSLTHNDDPTVHVHVQANGEMVTIDVIDDGTGIPEQEIEVLQQERETALEHGSGAGLWLADVVAEESGGELTFEREAGETTVSLQVPAAE